VKCERKGSETYLAVPSLHRYRTLTQAAGEGNVVDTVNVTKLREARQEAEECNRRSQAKPSKSCCEAAKSCNRTQASGGPVTPAILTAFVLLLRS